MLWQNLRLRTRILIGYSLILALIVTQGLLLMFRVMDLNSQIRQLSAEVAAEATASTRLAAQVATTQQATDRYLQQPHPENLRLANDSLRGLTDEINKAQVVFVSPGQREQVTALATQATAYQSRFETLSPLIETQTGINARLNNGLFDAQTALNDTTAKYVRSSEADPLVTDLLLRAQQKLQLTAYWTIRMVNEQNTQMAQSALSELVIVDSTLKVNKDKLDETSQQSADNTMKSTALITSAITEYKSNIAQVQQQRSMLLDEQGERLKRQAEALTTAALGRLTNATMDLEQQSKQAQQLTGAALLLTLLIVTVFGVWLPRTISRPLMDLVGATKRINQGDYAVAVSTGDRSEIGQLAASFNHMTATLSQQREEVHHQQAALAAQNQELAQTLAELRASTEAREELAGTIRKLSVPVVPILRRVILIPLVGEIDAERAELLLGRLLGGITDARARIAILDITGVPMVDVHLVDWLVRATMAAKLLGTQCILVGIGPEVAQSLVASGANLESLETRADLLQAVEHSIKTVMR